MNPVQHVTGLLMQAGLLGLIGGGLVLTGFVVLAQAIRNANARAARREAGLAAAIARHPATRSKVARSDRGAAHGVVVLLLVGIVVFWLAVLALVVGPVR